MKKYLNVIFGSFLLAIGIYLFVTPNNINFGGLVGTAQLIDYGVHSLFHLSNKVNLLGIINFLLNVPLFLIAYRIMNKDFCIKTLLSVAIQTVLLSVLPPLSKPLVNDMILNVVFGAMICGTGVGIALTGSGCCGGTDIATVCLVKKKPDLKSGKLSIYFNIILFSIIFMYFRRNC